MKRRGCSGCFPTLATGIEPELRMHGPEIDAAAVLLPIAVARRFGAFAAADFLRRWRFRNGLSALFRFGCRDGFAYHSTVSQPLDSNSRPVSGQATLLQPPAPVPAPTPWHALPDRRVVALVGRDAAKFAQAQFMNDVAALPAGHWQWNGWLTPKGRVIALFALLKFDDEDVRLLLQDADPLAFAGQLRRFVFRSRLAIEVRGDLHASGMFDRDARAGSGSSMVVAGDGTVLLDMAGDGGARTLRIAAAEDRDDPGARARWAAFDLEHGLPRLPGSQSSQWTPQQLSLERLRAYSVKKGCYPGQEIVARTHFLGQAKRGLGLFEGDAPLAPGAELTDGDRTLGTVVDAAAAGGRCLALAVLPLDAPATAPQAGGVALRPLPLRDGLAR